MTYRDQRDLFAFETDPTVLADVLDDLAGAARNRLECDSSPDEEPPW